MNIRLEKHSDLEATVVVELEKNDYTEKVEAQLKKIQKTANIKGFRPGKAPIGMIQKMYGKSILADEIQNLASEALNNYIETEKLETLGYPIGSTRVDSQLDIENSENFSFAFDLGMAPQFELNLNSKDQLENFEISVSDKEVDEDIDYARKRHAKLEDAEVSDEESIVYAEVTELNDKGEVLEGGVENKPVSFVPSMIEDKKLQQQFVGVSKDAVVTGDVRKLFNDNESVISNALGLPKEGINDLSTQFSIKVTEVKSRILPELTEDYFKEVLPGEEVPKNEEEYRNRVKTNLEHYYKNEASLWLDHEIGHLIMQKHDFNLPDEFLKRWLITTKPEHYTESNIDEKYAQEREALKRRLIIDKIAAANELQATEAEVIDEAKVYYAGMYRQYGLNISMGDEFLASTVMKRLEEREFVMQMSDRVIYRKAYDKVRELITLKTKNVNVEEYFNHVNKHKEAHGE